MIETASRRIEMPLQIQYYLQPFRGDRLNYPATFISNGRKVQMAAQAHIPHYITDVLANAMEVAENACHLRHETRVTGPTEVNGIPYPLVVVQEKGGAAERVMNSSNSEYGVGVVTDAVFVVEDADHKISFTAHKPKTKQEQYDLINLFMNASMKGNVRISTMTGIYRFEYGRPDRIPPELYMIQTHLGEIKHPLNIEKLLNHLSSNGGKTAAGLTVPLALELLVKPQKEIAVDILSYGQTMIEPVEHAHGNDVDLIRSPGKIQCLHEGGEDILKVIGKHGATVPKDGKTIAIPGYSIDLLHLAGVGFVN